MNKKVFLEFLEDMEQFLLCSKFKMFFYEKMILKLLDKKLFVTPRKAGTGKMKYFKEMDSFLVLPF